MTVSGSFCGVSAAIGLRWCWRGRAPASGARSVSLAVWFGVVGSAAMIVVWALFCALPLALSHDLGGPLGLVALAPMMALSRCAGSEPSRLDFFAASLRSR